MTRRGLLTGVAGSLALGGCSSLAVFDRLTPKDTGARRVLRDVGFGSGADQTLDLYAPREGSAGSRPVLVFFYGGNWASGDKDLYRWVGRALAAQGFVTAVPDYRKAPAHPYPAFVEDAAAAVAKAREIAPAYGGDPNRVLLMGHSAGAYLAILLALDVSRLKSVGVEPAALRGAAGLAGPYDFYPFDVEASRVAFGAWPRPTETQPITYARADAPPLWLAHGSDDRTVAVRHSRDLAARQQSLGAEATFRLYEGLNHVDMVLALSRPFRSKAPVLAEATAFLRRVSA